MQIMFETTDNGRELARIASLDEILLPSFVTHQATEHDPVLANVAHDLLTSQNPAAGAI